MWRACFVLDEQFWGLMVEMITPSPQKLDRRATDPSMVSALVWQQHFDKRLQSFDDAYLRHNQNVR